MARRHSVQVQRDPPNFTGARLEVAGIKLDMSPLVLGLSAAPKCSLEPGPAAKGNPAAKAAPASAPGTPRRAGSGRRLLSCLRPGVLMSA